MDRATALTRDSFNALNQLRALSGHEHISPQVLHRRMSELIERLMDGGRDSGVPDKDARDMAYAIAALADEIAINKNSSDGSIEEYWRNNLLQTKFFDENNAGVGFFQRLETLRRDHRRIEVLRVYYLCLLFGFQGQYLGRAEGDLRRLTDSVGNEVEQALEAGSELSPDGQRPDEAAIRRREKRPLLMAALASLAGALTIYIVLRVVLDSQTNGIIETLVAPTAGIRSGELQR